MSPVLGCIGEPSTLHIPFPRWVPFWAASVNRALATSLSHSVTSPTFIPNPLHLASHAFPAPARSTRLRACVRTRTQTVVQSWPTFTSSPEAGSAVFQPVMSMDMYIAASAKMRWKALSFVRHGRKAGPTPRQRRFTRRKATRRRVRVDVVGALGLVVAGAADERRTLVAGLALFQHERILHPANRRRVTHPQRSAHRLARDGTERRRVGTPVRTRADLGREPSSTAFSRNRRRDSLVGSGTIGTVSA